MHNIAHQLVTLAGVLIGSLMPLAATTLTRGWRRAWPPRSTRDWLPPADATS